MNKRILSAIIFVVSLVASSHAGTFTYSSRIMGTAIASAATLESYDDQYLLMSGVATTAAWHAVNINQTVKNYVHLKYTGAAKKQHTSDWSVQVICQVDRWDENGTPLTAEPCTLKVEYTLAAGTRYTDISSYKVLAPGHKMKVTVSSISYTGASIGTTMPADVLIENIIEVERTHAVDLTATLDIATSYTPCVSTVGPVNNTIDNTIEFHWDYVEGTEEYDLEWLFKSDYDLDATLDFSEATRITTSNQYYVINNVFDDGKIYYRIRPITKDFVTGLLRLEGPWTESVEALVVCNIEKRNWSYNSVFAEEGKRKEVMTYFDGSTRNRQALTLSNTENAGLVAESMYDYEGRPAVQTLPAPSRDYKSDLRFYEYFSLNTASTSVSKIPYSKMDFDNDQTGLCDANDIPGMKCSTNVGNGAAIYYSEYNTPLKALGFNALIPNINFQDESFPFTQTIYSPDGSVKMQSGAGNDHKIGSNHETQYLNGSAAQEKLDRLFGNEVGYAEHYREKAVIDPNGQVSVSYENLSGQVIATCMRGDTPGNMTTLGGGDDDNEPYMYPTDMAHSFTNSYDPASESYVSRENFIVTDISTNYNFTYKITAQQFEALCHDTLYSCQYLLQLTIKDDCNESVTTTSTVYTTPIVSGSIISDPVLNSIHHLNAKDYTTGDFQVTFSVDFPKVGVYRIEKRLWLDESALADYLVLYERELRDPENGCIQSLEDLQTIYAAEVDMTECMSCEEFAEWSSLWVEDEVAREYPYTDPEENYFVDAGAYEEFLIAQCDAEIPARSCDGLLAALRADMSPGGQYYEASITGHTDLTPACTTSGTYGSPLKYIDALINLSIVSSCAPVDITGDWADYAAAHACSTPTTFDYATVTATWDPCWADYLVRFHPEYCRYLRCVELTPSYDFDANMLNANYDEAILSKPTTSTPYLVIATTPVGKSVLDLDPYFTFIAAVSGSPISSSYSAMLEEIDGCTTCTSTTCFVSYGASPIATGAGFNATTPMWDWAKFFPEADGDINPSIRWSNFQKLYTATKAQYVKNFGCPALIDATYPPDNISDNVAGGAAFDFLGYLPPLVNTIYLNNMTINDPEPLNNFEAVTDGISDAIGSSDPDPVGDYDDVPDLCLYNSSTLTNTINTGVLGDAVVTNLAPGCGTPTFCEADWMTTPSSSDVAYTFYVKIDDVPLNYPIDNTPIDWINGNCYFRISNEFILPSMTGLSDGDITTHLLTLKNAVNFYTSSPYDFTCTTSSVTSGVYSYTIEAPTALGPLGSPSNLDILIKRKTNNGDSAFICSSQYLPDFTTATEDCNPEVPLAYGCLCVQLGQMNEFYQASVIDETLTFYEGGGSVPTYYYSFLEYAAAQLTVGAGTTVTIYDVDYWWRHCNLTSDEDQTFMQSPLDLDENGLVVESEYNDAHAIPAALDCDEEEPCQQQGLDEADFYANEEFEELIDEYLQNFAIEYKKACLHEVNLAEEFKVEYIEKEYHYTLYYYDQAGNLVRTVPPNSVRRLVPSIMYSGGVNLVHDARIHANDLVPPTPVYPDHSRIAHTGGDTVNLMVTNYKYNTLNQLVQQETPDGGLSNFWYNDIGQLRFSQNEKQFLDVSNNALGQYSYTIYDGQGRIGEVGENHQDFPASPSALPFYNGVNDPVFPTDPGTEVTKTYYDAVIPTLGLTQNYLRKRVSTSTYEDVEDGSDLTFSTGSHYSYDVHGNVNKLVQDYPALTLSGNRFKTIEYEYDLISGNVSEVAYQPGEFDQYYHRYEYDANNRITHAYTSNDEAHWQEDARYFYYLHGPLARVEIGEDNVQGLDYAYNIQGWIKSVNSNTFELNADPGKDALTGGATYPYMASQIDVHQNVAADVFGYVLDYFTDDYKSIGTNSYSGNNFNTDLRGNMSLSGIPNLFNGNIKAMSTAMYKPVSLSNPVQMPTMAKFFHYDQLNRIKQAKAYELTANTTIGSLTPWSVPQTSDYYEEFSYDANGNILHAKRNGYAALNTNMDEISYLYASTRVNNQLNYVDDDPFFTAYTDDIDAQVTGNYTYDSIGNLRSDFAENISNIEWNVYGKIKKITKTSGLENIEFRYDPSGNRIAKIVKPKTGSSEKTQEHWTTTYYVRDAQGNVMAVYDHDVTRVSLGAQIEEHLRLKETHIYGSSRLGIEDQIDRNSFTPGIRYDFGGHNGDGTVINDGSELALHADPVPFDHTMGNKQYELSNHLGNVNVVISDRKLAIDANSNTFTDSYLADVLSSTDYYSFGAVMPSRHFSSDSYRYGFNGKENDNEVKGVQGSSVDYGARVYDPRLGRWLAVDPLAAKYDDLTPYNFAANNPIYYIDPDGKAIIGADDKTVKSVGAGQPMKVVTSSGVYKELTAKFETGAEYDKFMDIKFATAEKPLDSKGAKDMVAGGGTSILVLINDEWVGLETVSPDDASKITRYQVYIQIEDFLVAQETMGIVSHELTIHGLPNAEMIKKYVDGGYKDFAAFQSEYKKLVSADPIKGEDHKPIANNTGNYLKLNKSILLLLETKKNLNLDFKLKGENSQLRLTKRGAASNTFYKDNLYNRFVDFLNQETKLYNPKGETPNAYKKKGEVQPNTQ